ncbi:hypothetical protein [Nocardioides sp. Root140]|uniref:hypothetical protein n=1 Tax=Nocardioides sp. Root140 TaxID=1736460 RepID=UPI0006FCAE80|nr:hypothetical protein [Nocardioides sp. Root140]KQY54594.1 hypothetical protein ASD30_18295 [Nocardioides sp. Root140]
MVSSAQRVSVVAGSHKLGKVALARICDASAICQLITDDAADAEAVAALSQKAGVTRCSPRRSMESS